MIEVTYSEARANLASLWDKIIEDQDMALVTRRGKGSVVIMPADEIESWLETWHIFRTPANARRIEESIAQAERGEVMTFDIEAFREKHFPEDE